MGIASFMKKVEPYVDKEEVVRVYLEEMGEAVSEAMGKGMIDGHTRKRVEDMKGKMEEISVRMVERIIKEYGIYKLSEVSKEQSGGDTGVVGQSV